MVPKEWIQPIRNGFRLMRTHIVMFSRLTRDGEVKKKHYFYHHRDTICHPKSGYVTTKLHGTSTCRCNNNAIFSDSYFQVSCRLRMPATLIWSRRSIDSSCQTGKMAALLNSLFFVFNILFPPRYHVV